MKPRPALRAVVALAVAPLLWTTACGGSTAEPDPDTSSPTASPSTERELDLDAIGDGLLSSERWGGPVPGDTVSGTWRFPESYEPTGDSAPNNEATSQGDDADYRMLIGAYPLGDGVEAAAEDLSSGAEEAGQTVESEPLTIAGREFVSVTQEDGPDSRRNLFYAPDEGSSVFLIVLEAGGTTLEETPVERVEELYQTAASLEVELTDG